MCFKSSCKVRLLSRLQIILIGSLNCWVASLVLWFIHSILLLVSFIGSLLATDTSRTVWFASIARYKSLSMAHSCTPLQVFINGSLKSIGTRQPLWITLSHCYDSFFMVHYRQMSRVIFLGSLVSDVTDLTLRFTSQGSY